MSTIAVDLEFAATRLGVIMRPQPGQPHEAWGVLNPGGVRSTDGVMHFFPRLIAEGNYSRIGHAHVRFEADKPVGVDRLAFALEPHESYEVNSGGGGVEDSRVVYMPSLKLYVMTYTAFVPYEPRVAVAVSSDLVTWRRLGVLRYEIMEDGRDLNACGNKDAAFFSEVVADPQGVPSYAILHRPTTRLHFRRHHPGTLVAEPPSGDETQENIWISYIPVAAVASDITSLTSVRRHERVMAPEQAWEARKVGTGAPPVRVDYGWVLTYHAVSALSGHPRYCMGVAVLDADRPSRVLYRTPSPILEPLEDYERNGLVHEVVFPSATDLRADGALDVYYGAADHVIAAARVTLPGKLPVAPVTLMSDKHESETQTTTETRTEYKTERGPESTIVSKIVSTIETKTESAIDYKAEAESSAVATSGTATDADSDAKPADAAKPDPSNKPADAAKRDPDSKPADAAKPDPDSKPADAAKPDPDSKPADAAKPDPDSKPADAATPDPDSKPADAAKPDPDSKPADAATPDPDSKPADAAKPDPDSKPADAATPDPDSKPADAAKPDPDSKPADAATPDPDSKPADAAKPDAKNPDPSAKSPSDAKNDLKSLAMPELFKKLGSTKDGLSVAEATKRLTKYGPNEITEKTANPLLKFLSYFWGPIAWMIEAAVILSAVVRHWLDFGVILLLLCTNAVVGFWEEHQAGNAISALKKQLATNARVLRDGKWTNPKVADLVPGDVVRIRLGDIVPGDARLLAGDPIEIDQSALTGESLPVTRKPGEAIFSGSIVRQGETDAIIYATGTKTYFGKTAALVQKAQTVSHFQKAVLKIGNYLIVLAVALVSVIVAVSVFVRHDPLIDTFEFALVLLVAAIPVAMPTVLSVTMAVGARLLSKKNAIVTKLASIEELAGVDILCSDKTGTLTENKLTLGDPFSIGGMTADKVILYAALASRKEDKDTIDLAVLGGVKDEATLKPFDILHFQPFDPVHKRTEATVKDEDGKQFFVAKGAPQVILAMAKNAADVKPAVEKAVNGFAGRGYRSLGVAKADEKDQWQFVGVIPMFDPPRPTAKATLASAEQMGVHVKMVTGDQVAIAVETARTLGLGTNILDAKSLGDTDKKATNDQAKAIEDAAGFAQVFPEHKYHIVETLQDRGHLVGMTGDGVNDAPALKKANCGIAVSGATDAARAAASIVLMTPGLTVIIDAIKESRRIVQRMNSYAIYRVAETLRVLGLMTIAILFFNFYPITAVMIVILALLNDGAILAIAYDNVLYKKKPEAWNMRLVLEIASVLGVVGVITAFGLFFLGDRVFHLGHPQLQTLMYLKLSVAGHLTVFIARTRGPFWSIRPARILWIAVLGTQAFATLMAVYGFHLMTPIGWGWAAFVWGYALISALLTDPIKLLAYRIFDRTAAAAPVAPKKPLDQPQKTATATS